MSKLIRLSDYYCKVKSDAIDKVKDAIQIIVNSFEIKNIFEVKGETYFLVKEYDPEPLKPTAKIKKDKNASSK